MSVFKPNSELSQERLKEILAYNPETGLFHWKVARGRIYVGMQAGSLTPEGYVRITIDRHRFMAHTLAWLDMTGEYISRGIDHRDTLRSNNKWTNLRRATQSQNNMNMKVRSDNALGVKCVQKKKGAISQPYFATIKVNGKQRQLGYCSTIEEAAESYRAAALKYFGEFARAI